MGLALICQILVLCGGCHSGGAGGASDGGADAGDVMDASPKLLPDASPDSGAEGGTGISADLCNQMCQLAAQISCPNQPTVDACVTTCLGATTCTPALGAFLRCVVDAGPPALGCNQAQGAIVLQGNFCGAENAALIACVTGR